MRTLAKTVTVSAVAVVAATLLAACGGSDEGASPSASMSMPASAMASTPASSQEPLIGGDPATWSPILIKKKTKSIQLVPNQVAVFPAFEYAKNPNYVAVSSDPAVVEVLEADNDSVVALHAVGLGDAVVKVYQGTADGGQGKYLRKVKVSVTEQ